jgi:hypothetical protein
MSDYSELLRHPLWQRRRLEIFKRDNFACKKCTDTTSNLQVHHIYYKYDLLPWEYPDEALITICDLCHEKTEFMKKFIDLIWQLTKQGFTPADVQELYGLIKRRLMDNHHKQSAREYMENIKLLING